MTGTASDTHTSQVGTSLFIGTLPRLTPRETNFPADGPLQLFVDDAFASLGRLLGYFAIDQKTEG
jgi:hypothetical protein